MILILPVHNPIGMKYNQRVDAVRAIFHRKFDTRKQEDFLFLCRLHYRIELITVKLVVIRDNSKLNGCFLECRDEARDE